ncbi:putative aliphatic nitrilase [Periconia macrospinosa]|uniref:Putative aliphatic nitrilase n=1 Tax=Periconia macrospinosa TaxID=97972 RepID=A0A2V1DRP5_9PLEO|nr:putative aliphatic nitrilase [Periconia macrospinosa]
MRNKVDQKLLVKRSDEDIVSKWDLNNITLAAIRSPPVNWPMPVLNKNWDGVKFDINATVDLGLQYMKQAAQNGARLVAFPEVWFPGYPKGVINEDYPNSWLQKHATEYIDNSIIAGDSNWQKLIQGAIDNEIYLAVSISEKDTVHLFMTQLLISPSGKILTHRHKIRPGGRERELWTDGRLEGLRVVSTPIGRIGMLSCAEHTYPEANLIMQAQTEDIHIGAWPLTPAFGNMSLGYEATEVIASLAHSYANIGNTAFVLTSIGSATIYAGGASPHWTRNNDDDSFTDVPIVYRSVNSTAFPKTEYNADNGVSWASFQNINLGFPSYIPQDLGTYVPWHQVTIEQLRNMSMV